jgi:exodeoxyribonuclease VII small subunit
MAEKKTKDDVSTLNFEESIKRLKGIVDKIEQGDIPLQDSLDQYEQGMVLINRCRDILQKAEKRIEKISKAEPQDRSVPDESAAAEDEGLF